MFRGELEEKELKVKIEKQERWNATIRSKTLVNCRVEFAGKKVKQKPHIFYAKNNLVYTQNEMKKVEERLKDDIRILQKDCRTT